MKCLICLGRHGDQVNALGIAYHYRPVDFICSVAYSTVPLGASYVNRVALRCTPDNLPFALAHAKRHGYEKILVAQTYGRAWTGRRDLPYNQVAWLECGLSLDQFHDTSPILFDRRDPEREKFLLQQHVKGKKPLLVLAVAAGRSSPFASHLIFSNAVARKWGRVFEILNLCHVRAARLYDILSILERARVIVSSDSFVLHLAAATSAPVIGLVNDLPFCASQLRGKCLLRIPYREVVGGMRKVHQAIESVLFVAKPETAPAVWRRF